MARWIRLVAGTYVLRGYHRWDMDDLAAVDQQMRAADTDWKWHVKFKDWTGVYMDTKEEAMAYAETILKLQGVIE